ncbi:MAG: MFS transporter [Acetobacteraceae bacterium]
MSQTQQDASILTGNTGGVSATGRPTHVRWRIIALLAVLYTVNCIDRISLSVSLPLISQEFVMSATVKGLILSAFFWSYCGFQVPSGWLIDRWGGRRAIGVAATLWGAFQCLAAAATGGGTLLLSRVALGMFEAPYMPASGKLTAAWLPPIERSRGITLIDSGAALGSALGGLIISSLILLFDSWRLAFLSIGGLTIILGLFVYTQLRDLPSQHPSVNAAEQAVIAAGEAVSTDEIARNPLSRLSFAGMIVGRMGWTMIFFGLVTWGPSYLSAARGMDIRSMGVATFAIFLAGAAGEIFSGVLVDTLQRFLPRDIAFKLLFAASGIGVLTALLLLPFIQDPVIAVTVLSAGLFFHFFGGLYWSIPAMLVPRHRIGLVGGIMNFAGTSSGIVVPIILGMLVDATGGYDAGLGFLAICAAVYLVGSLLIDFRRPGDGRRAARAVATL